MDKTQFLICEITNLCNRGAEHAACPNMAPERWGNSAGRRPMTDAQIVDVAAKMYAGGFTGCVAWHHYCEPLMAQTRLLGVIQEIRKQVPQSRFLLWTNGDLFPEDLSAFDGVFEKMMVTNYAGRDLERLQAICPEINLISTNLDWRRNPPSQAGRDHCIRPYLEIIFDYYGNVRTCCMDWKNETGIGNIHDTPFEELWQRWLVQRDKLEATPMAADAPQRCLNCGTRYSMLAHYVPEIAARTLTYLAKSKEERTCT
jgi:hypothetical protein